jgi:pimeloyl-ACP methyl ester carboxylesterase
MNSTIDVNGNKLACTVLGDSSHLPILFVHDLMSHRGVWMRTMGHFQDRYYCIAIDLLGFGESDKPVDGDYSIQSQAERVLQVADHFNLKTFDLVGHSMGGQISLYLASQLAPERVKRLVSVGGVSRGALSKRATNLNMRLVKWARNAPWLYRTALSLSRFPWYAHWAFKVWFFKPASIPFESWKIDRDMALNPKGATSSYQAWQSLSQTNLRRNLPQVTAQTLVIHGLQDGTVPVVNATLVKSRVPGTRLIFIDECGHFPMYEQFDTYVHYLDEFLS